MLAGCWLVAGWLMAGCWVVAGWLLVGCWWVAGWLFNWLVVSCSSVGAPFFWLGTCLRAPAADSRVVSEAIPQCSYSSARSNANSCRKASWNPDVLLHDALGMLFVPAGSWSTSLARPVRSRCASLRGFRHAFCASGLVVHLSHTASASDLARLECELWKTQTGMWNPDVLVYEALGMRLVRTWAKTKWHPGSTCASLQLFKHLFWEFGNKSQR